MGKSLGLMKHGNHVAFVAGTGILVFLDLVAMLAKANLGLLNNGESLPIFAKDSTFHLTLYYSIASDTAALGLDLLQSLQARSPPNFTLHLRISNQTRSQDLISTRWDPVFIRTRLNQADLAKVYVCGPPNMTEMFDRTLGEMIS